MGEKKRGADFYCNKAGLVIELGGSVHDDTEHNESDARRDKALNEIGLRIIHFRNKEVMKNLSQVVGRIPELVPL